MCGDNSKISTDWHWYLSADGMKTAEHVTEYGKNGLNWHDGYISCYKDVTFDDRYGVNKWGGLEDEDGNIITDPYFFDNKEITLTIKDGNGSLVVEQSHTFDYDIAGLCTTDPLKESPKLDYDSDEPFDEDNCSSTFTISFKREINNADYFVSLYTSNKKNNKPSGQLQVENSQGRDITTEIDEDGVFVWKPSNKGTLSIGKVYFQIGVYGQNGECIESPTVYSTTKSFDITCLNIEPEVEIQSIIAKDYTEVFTNDRVDLKEKGPFIINVFAKTDDTEKPKNIRIEISYDSENEFEMKQFYKGKRPDNFIVRTINYVPPLKTSNCIYEVEWDGRDDIDERILLEGDYVIKAFAEFSMEGSHSIKLKTATPKFKNLGLDYATTDQFFIDKMIAEGSSTPSNHDFDNVDILKNDVTYTDYEWLRQFSYMVNNNKLSIKNYSDYEKEDVGGNVLISEEKLVEMQNAAVLGFIGHSSMETTNPTRGFLIFDNSTKLLAGCPDMAPCLESDVCSPEYVCIKNRCYIDSEDKCQSIPRNGSFEDVALSVLIGCRTNIGTPSLAQELLDQGTDCVIATLTRIDRRVMSFYYRYFCEQLFIDQVNISLASQNAFDKAVRSIAHFYTTIDDDAEFPEIQTNVESHPNLD